MKLPIAVIGAHCCVRSRKHRRGQCRGLLPVRQLSCRMRGTTGCRAAAAGCRACRGDSGHRRTGCRGSSWNTHEPWRSGQSRGQALRNLLVCGVGE